MDIGKVKMREGKMEEGIDSGIRCNTNDEGLPCLNDKGCTTLETESASRPSLATHTG